MVWKAWKEQQEAERSHLKYTKKQIKQTECVQGYKVSTSTTSEVFLLVKALGVKSSITSRNSHQLGNQVFKQMNPREYFFIQITTIPNYEKLLIFNNKINSCMHSLINTWMVYRNALENERFPPWWRLPKF